ncbi:MAG TPA: DUF6457 domain-containing protein [Acidimicrobiales bacterium]|nr:DUF6457 domain-containing protein [Acidimicrobiales bacterium]
MTGAGGNPGPTPSLSAAAWTSRLAARLGVDVPAEAEISAILAMAGVAAHASERTAAPVTAWMAAAAGLSTDEALALVKVLAEETGDRD